ncbi:MAG: penicillin acylase family protein [Rhodothermales bacterium]|nr:penicillin acylase family protein [Rhodothermales bacterium]
MRIVTVCLVLFELAGSPTANAQEVDVPGLDQPVEVLRDPWGINHIYAETEHDLFFAQGYMAARDRLFQFEVWRRQATGTVAELLGPRELERDIGTRLFRFRGDITDEMNHYHDRGAAIITAFVDGVNAYIAETERDPSLLPIEFELLGTRPELWTPDVVISRHQGLLGNINAELRYGRAVAAAGPEEVLKVAGFEPGTPDIALDPAIDGDALSADILGIYNAYRRPVRFQPEDLAAAHRPNPDAWEHLAAIWNDEIPLDDRENLGSNNWVVDSRLSVSGFPMMANDPHRTQAAPSLRYWAHLVGPGWDVIGGGEPEIPGISIGHNGFGAWGLTVFQTDAEDLYVYETNPDNPDQYRYRGAWENMEVEVDTIHVRGADPVVVRHRYTRHGPVTYQDGTTAYAVRAGWLEIGGSPYLASLRMDQAQSWEEFREACAYSHIPGENMIWADADGTIGWQSVGIAPVRPNWSGLVPVPGDGRYEWDDYLPMLEKPWEAEPDRGWIATANNELVPDGYPHRDAVGWEWSDPFRYNRIAEELSSGRIHSVADMMTLQTDYLSIPARTLVPMLRHIGAPDVRTASEALALVEWDYLLTAESREAAVYVVWEGRVRRAVSDVVISESVQPYIGSLSMSQVLSHLAAPGPEFAALCSSCNPLEGRDALLMRELGGALEDLDRDLGGDPADWQFGHWKTITMRHPMTAAVGDEMRNLLDVGVLPRGGNSYTVNQTGGGRVQRSGASFRIIVDTGNWDASVGMNAPGQSGDPSSPYYRNLFGTWAADGFFPVYYSREKVEAAAEERLGLQPKR